MGLSHLDLNIFFFKLCSIRQVTGSLFILKNIFKNKGEKHPMDVTLNQNLNFFLHVILDHQYLKGLKSVILQFYTIIYL